MSQMFSAKREDGRAEWRVVYDHVVPLTYGTCITFKELGDLLGVSPLNEKHHIYNAVAMANPRLWAKAQRSLGVVRGVGYRVLQPEEHELQANGYKRKAKRRLSNAVSVMQATDVSNMETRAREWVLQVTAGMVLMARAIDDHEQRLAKHDDLISQLTKRINKLEDDQS